MSKSILVVILSLLATSCQISEQGSGDSSTSSISSGSDGGTTGDTGPSVESSDLVASSDFELKLTPVISKKDTNKSRAKYVGDFTIKGVPQRILYYQLEEIGERDNDLAGIKSLEAFQESKFSTKLYITAENVEIENLEKELQSWKLTVWYLPERAELPALDANLELPAQQWATPKISIIK